MEQFIVDIVMRRGTTSRRVPKCGEKPQQTPIVGRQRPLPDMKRAAHNQRFVAIATKAAIRALGVMI